MAFPGWLARFNRRAIGLVARRFAGRLPPLAIVVHRGRRTGVEYATPVMAFATTDGYAIALTYGPDADWVQNVLVAGGCGLIRGGRWSETADARLVGVATAIGLLPPIVRPMTRANGVREVQVVDRAAGRPSGGERSSGDH
ncbi:MAG: hypothetical protein AVDCRST_MAG73-3088 [uncultured Thermomicrobiales bacterium]|uniref:Nitroreductase family deazaflavin-dependent oxidoreductase n=1 Tax=uncultured Thermomicrobiales bacterium TaxID=1645740 RepID=A0A6J4UJM7_9BACT|nr:MAG: hypothetical protein AVDCRST_MAG73-3088 [uncultured Thermomicrobiales bacterium]